MCHVGHMIKNTQQNRPADPAHCGNLGRSRFLLEQDKGERENTGSNENGRNKGRGKEGWSGEEGDKRKKWVWGKKTKQCGNRMNRREEEEGNGVIRDSEHKEKPGGGWKAFCSDGGGGEEGENRGNGDRQEEGRSRATVPWQRAVEGGNMAAGDTAPGQIWSSRPSSVLLSINC